MKVNKEEFINELLELLSRDIRPASSLWLKFRLKFTRGWMNTVLRPAPSGRSRRRDKRRLFVLIEVEDPVIQTQKRIVEQSFLSILVSFIRVNTVLVQYTDLNPSRASNVWREEQPSLQETCEADSGKVALHRRGPPEFSPAEAKVEGRSLAN